MRRAGPPRPARPPRRARPVAASPAGPARELAIDTIAAGGDGVGRDGGLVVFVPRTAPGDVVRARWDATGRFARGVLVDVVRPSTERVEPPCPHYREDHCGGCQLQHLSADAQREAKRRLVADALARIAKRPVEIDPVLPSPAAWRYRRKLTLALRRRGSSWVGGLHPYDAPGEVFALQDCPITDERVLAVWREVVAASRLFPFDARELRGAVRLLGGATDGATPATFTLVGGARWPAWETFVNAVPSLAGLWWQPDGAHRRLLHTRREASAGASFAQVNAPIAARLRADVVAALRERRPATFVDAYAGVGDVAVALAGAGARTSAIELDAEAAALAGARLAPLGGRSVRARVEDALASVLPAAAVLVNPPRTGLDAAVPEILERAADGAFGPPPEAIVYVSCNPATLARDLARMPSYAIRRVTPYDMFPQTAHVETLVVLERVVARGSEVGV
ncbi:hypothetical protein tb265_37130 [Gemmatimonadetes bacterium T265]|nr:hypothetical protein tb265_37130 [Gemmatimonadetes bacterium T265]